MTLLEFQNYRPIIGSGISNDGRWAYAVVSTPTSQQDFDATQTYVRRADVSVNESEWIRVAPEASHSYSASIAPGSAQLLFFEGAQPAIQLKTITLDDLDEPAQGLHQPPSDPMAGKWIATPPRPSCLGTDNNGLRRIFFWDEPTNPCEAMGPDDWNILDYCAIGDSGRVAAIGIQQADLGCPDVHPSLVILEADGQSFSVYELSTHAFGYLCANDQGTRLGFLGRVADTRLASTHLWVINLDELSADEPPFMHCVTAQSVGWVTGYDWCPEGDSVIAACREGTHGLLHYFDKEGSARTFTPENAYISGPSVDRSGGRMLYLKQDGHEPQHLVLSDINQSTTERFSAFSESVQKTHKTPCETVRWTNPQGETLEGVWYGLPTPEDKPVIIWLHGGPAEHMNHTYSPYFQIFLEAGFQVFAPNYTGSTGRDEAFLHGNINKLGVLDVEDVISAITFLQESGLGTPDKISLFGWSYGGTLALLTAAKSDKIKAVIAGAPVIDWVTIFGSPLFPAISQTYFPGPIWEDRAPYDAASPVSHLATMNTPTLVFQGEEDPRIPRSQSLLLYRLLQEKGVDTDLRFFPGQGHVFSHPMAINDMLNRSLGWLKLHNDIDDAP